MKENMSVRALFVDRDGVLNANFVRNGKAYAPRSLAEFRLLPGVEGALRRAKDAGFRVIVVTNQPDVANGLTPRAEVDAMHAWLHEHLPIDDIRICFHTDSDHCECRKPKPGLLLEAAGQYEIDLEQSYMVGDRWRDILAGQAAGCFTILVDYGLAQEQPSHPGRIVRSLAEAVDSILARRTDQR
ncbi:MAG TPA: HAD family hydrolase [Stellaceae bacterium]